MMAPSLRLGCQALGVPCVHLAYHLLLERVGLFLEGLDFDLNLAVCPFSE
jgi:hypothetical protein